MSKYKLKLNKLVLSLALSIVGGCALVVRAEGQPAEASDANSIIVSPDELFELEARANRKLLDLLQQPLTKRFSDYCNEFIELWKHNPKFKELCIVLESIKGSKDPKELKAALSRFNHLFSQELQDRINNMSYAEQFAFRKRLLEAMRR